MPEKTNGKKPAGPNKLFAMIGQYKKWIAAMLGLAVLSNALSLVIPRLVSSGIDAFNAGTYNASASIIPFLVIIFFVLVLTYASSLVQTFTSERVARDLRQKVSDKISRQAYSFVQKMNAGRLLTNLTSDVDAVKMFVSMAIVSLASSMFLIIGASTLLIITNWKLGLAVLAVVPIIGFTFFFIFSRVGALFRKSQSIIDKLNKTINESILGAALVRVLHGQKPELEKFRGVNTEARDNSMKILRVFASMIPVITFISSAATLIILSFGGHLVIAGEMTVGQLAAFNSYVTILIFPMLMIGFMSNAIARASASYERIAEVLESPDVHEGGSFKKDLDGAIDVEHVTVKYGETPVLKDVSFSLPAHTRTAILGPTAAGKTNLLYVLTGLIAPSEGVVKYDRHGIMDYERKSIHAQVGLVFQDSIIFNLSLRENIAFGQDVSKEKFQKALDTAELSDFVNTLPEGLETVISERGTTLSGGQKQRVMLARALALDPKVLLLDDFTARVDTQTEHRILANVRKNYPDLTLVSVTQKIASVEDYDKIILLMEGEVLAEGTHAELMQTSPEYVQIYESQRSTNRYER